MKTWIPLTLLLFLEISFAQSDKIKFVTTDISNFWNAYDKMAQTNDSLHKSQIFESEYLDKASPGLNNLMDVRRYTLKEYTDAIRDYPKFWNSIRTNTTSVQKLFPGITRDIEKLGLLYPNLKPRTIYFSIGVFRTNGITRGNHILIGSEAALADNNTVIEELPPWRLPFFKENSQIDNIGLLVVHEYIHTLQRELVHNLLSMCLYEGIAEFISCKATGKVSTVPAIAFGMMHHDKVVEQFVADMFLIRNNTDWLWGENRNQFQMRDLGYYIGYQFAERYYNLSDDKLQAIKELIELDYHNEREVERIVDTVRLFPKHIAQLYAEFDALRPRVVRLKPSSNLDGKVQPGKTKLTIEFSEPLNGHHTGIVYGPLGADHFPAVAAKRIWSEDKKSWTIDVDLKPNMHYQIMIDNSFRNDKGVPLKPYLIDFKTGK